MDFKSPLKKIGKALARKDIVAEFTVYIIKNNKILATDGRLVACCPLGFECPDMLVPGDMFEKLINRLDSIDDITKMDGSRYTFKAGRSRGTIQVLQEFDTPSLPRPFADWSEPAPDFVDALRRARPFISDNAIHPWAMSVCLGKDRMLATNNIVLAEVECVGAGGNGQLLPFWAVDFILGRDEELDGIQIHPEHMSFRFDDGSWLRTQLLIGEFPAVVLKMLTPENWKPGTHELTNDWKEAYAQVAGVAETSIEIYKDKIVGRSEKGYLEAEVDETPVPAGSEYSSWAVRYLTPVIEQADWWAPDSFPQPASFEADGIRGFVVGRR